MTPLGDPLGKTGNTLGSISAMEDEAAARVRRLQAELEALQRARAGLANNPNADDPASQRAKLRARLFELVDLLKERMAAKPVAPSNAGSRGNGFTSTSRPVDQMRQIVNLYRAGDSQAALRAIQLIDPTSISRQQALTLKYLTASCHRRLSDAEQAKRLYLELANQKDDPFLATCAGWQLDAIQTREAIAVGTDTTRKRSVSK